MLRAGDGGAEPPQPTLDAIPALIEESRAAGMKVQAHDRRRRGGDALIGRTAYRVVQEGLTNARKHAPAAAVEVTVRRRGAARGRGRQPPRRRCAPRPSRARAPG